MGKRIALKDGIVLDGTPIGNLCRDIKSASDHERVDVSGFNAGGTDEFLAGKTTQGVTLEVYGSYAADEIHQTLYPVHRDRAIVPFKWLIDQTAAVSATNPELRGNVQCLNYNPGATRGQPDTFSVELTCPDEAGLKWYDTAAA